MCGSGSNSPGNGPGNIGTVRMHVTFYGAEANGQVAYPPYGFPGGRGTFSDPVTFASDPDELPIHSLVYVKALQKYFIHNDRCQQCTTDWNTSRLYHIDLWMSSAPGNVPCADTLVTALAPTTPVIIDPPAGLPVSSQAIWDGSGCFTLPEPLPTS